MLLFSFVGPLLYHTDQIHPDLLRVTLRPSAQFPLGTDEVGYNVLGRLMVAGQSSLEVGLAAAAIAGIVGTLWGAVAGFAGGWVDSIMMRIVDALLAIPALLLVLLLTTIVTPSIIVVIIVLGLISWLATARLVRGQVLVLKSLEYVQAAQGFGERAWQIVLRHGGPSPRKLSAAKSRIAFATSNVAWTTTVPMTLRTRRARRPPPAGPAARRSRRHAAPC